MYCFSTNKKKERIQNTYSNPFFLSIQHSIQILLFEYIYLNTLYDLMPQYQTFFRIGFIMVSGFPAKLV